MQLKQLLAACALFMMATSSNAEDAIDQARQTAFRILSNELRSPLCQPNAIPAEDRAELASALWRVKASDPKATKLTPLELAVLTDDVAVFKQISNLGYPIDSPNSALLHDAAFHNSTKIFQYLLSQGVSADSPTEAGMTPLMAAAMYGRHDLAKVLISAGADINAKTQKGGTALTLAKACQDQAMIDLLVSSGTRARS